MNQLVSKAPQLPAEMIQQIAAGLARSQIGAGGNSGQTLLKLLTTGAWVMGQTNDQVQQGSRWLVNIASFKHGWICWYESQNVGEVMTDMWLDAPAQPASHASGTPFKAQLACQMKCMDGTDAGRDVLYKVNSHGGKTALHDLKEAVRKRLQTMPGSPWVYPVLELSSSSYPNKKHGGLTWNPILTIVAWADINGEMETDGDTGEDAPEAVQAAPQPAKPPLRPAVQAAPVNGQRRRPAAR